MLLTVVSTPAVSSERATIGVSSGVSSPVSAAAWIAAPTRPVRGHPLHLRFSHAITGRVGNGGFEEPFCGPNGAKTMLP